MMQLGFAMLESGSVREHNVVATLAKNVLDVLIGTLTTCAWAFNLAYGSSNEDWPLSGGHDRSALYHHRFLFFLAFQATAATIVSGAMAERTLFSAYVIITCVVAGVAYPLAVRLAWAPGAWLQTFDPPFIDFAGSGVVHGVGGCAALLGAIIVGPRAGRFDPKSLQDFSPHNVPSVLSGVLLLFVSWFAFNCGSTGQMHSTADARSASIAATSTAISCMCGGVAAGLLSQYLQRNAALLGPCSSQCLGAFVQWPRPRIDLLESANGMLAGLCAITAGCASVDMWAAAAIGLFAGCIYSLARASLRRLKVDDVVNAFSVHGACGLWGVIAVGFFNHEDGLVVSGRPALLGTQCIGALVLGLIGASCSLVICTLLRLTGHLRVSREDEERGLDAAFGLKAYTGSSDALMRCRTTADLLQEQGNTPIELLDALVALRGVVHRPFTPQAADNKLEGEVKDLLDTFSYEKLGAGSKRHIAFLSHHKKDTGDAARIFVDTARRLLTSGDGFLSSMGNPSGAASIKATRTRDMIWLDSSNLKSLPELINKVKEACNFVLFLSRHVLERPWVLAELTAAHSSGQNISTVLVEWPSGSAGDRFREFRFPQDLDRAIHEWSWFLTHAGRVSNSGSTNRRANGERVGAASGALQWRGIPRCIRRNSGGADSFDSSGHRRNGGVDGLDSSNHRLQSSPWSTPDVPQRAPPAAARQLDASNTKMVDTGVLLSRPIGAPATSLSALSRGQRREAPASGASASGTPRQSGFADGVSSASSSGGELASAHPKAR